MEHFRNKRILIVDDEAPIREILKASLEDDHFVVEVAEDGLRGIEKAQSFLPDIILLDIWMPGQIDGIQVLEKIKELQLPSEIIMMSGHGTIETAVKAVKMGAWDFLEKPLSMEKVTILIQNILSLQSERIEKQAILNRLRRNIAIIGADPKIVEIKETLARVSTLSTWILISGEKGSGKELVAQNLHFLSPRAGRSFVEVNCSALPQDLFEIELFGYEKGAFTGAHRGKKGKFDLADGGTLFLDEVSHLSLEAQGQVLRFLQEKTFRRVGGATPIEADIRVIASSSVDLLQCISAGTFREDLYYRLSALPLAVPSLRERKDDIPALIAHFSEIFARETGYRRKTFSDSAMALLCDHRWPGNVRELRNFIERLYILTPTDEIDLSDLKFAGFSPEVTQDSQLWTEIPSFREARAVFEKEYIVKKLQQHNGNISRTAEEIGLERSYLHRKLKTYKIDLDEE